MVLPSRLFCDTSFFYACLDSKDVNHGRAEELTNDAVTSSAAFLTSWDVIGETITLLRYRKGFRVALNFLEEVKPNLIVVEYGQRVRVEAEQVFRLHGRSRRLSFCDAISFVLVTSLLDHMPCLAFDQDFRALGVTVIG